MTDKINILGLVLSFLLLTACGGGGNTSSGGTAFTGSTLSNSITFNQNSVGTTFNASYAITQVITGDPATRLTVDFVLTDVNGNLVAGRIH